MDATESSPEHVDKGKRRATEATECTPLLASSSRAPSTLSEEAGHPAQSRRGLHRKLKTVFFASLVVCILAFALLGILAWSYASRASALNADDIIHQDLVVAGPDAIEIVNVSQAGAWLNIQGRIGVDAGKAIGVGSNTEDGILDNLWKAFGRWSVRTLDRITVDVSTIRIATDSNKNLDPFLYIDLPQIELPLTVDPPNDTTWLTPMSTLIFIRPTSNTTAWLNFLKESWRRGRLSVHAFVDQAVIRGGPLDKSDWRSILTKKQLGVHTLIDLKLPSIPGIPAPGPNFPFPSVSKLVTLTSFRISSESDTLSLHGTATAVNPVPYDLDFSSPSLPFDVSIFNPINSGSPAVHVASVSTLPFTLARPNVTVSLQGYVSAISHAAFPALSNFVSRYLSGQSNDVAVGSPLVPSLSAEVIFPGPNPRPDILRNVTIKDMKIKPTGSVFLASGIVHAQAVLPKEIDVGLDVFRVFPDVLIFDGEVPSNRQLDISTGPPPETPLPDPLPENAFGHIRPDDWLPSESEPIESEDGRVYSVSARVVDVPLEVLPGRQKEFSSFVRKVIFGTEGATAGIMGTAAVTVSVEGIPLDGQPGPDADKLVLTGLPFQGRVHIGKKGLLGFDDDDEPEQETTRERWKRRWKEILRKMKERLPHF